MLPIPRRGILAGIGGVQDARAVRGIEEVTITATLGEELVPLPEGTRYLGFMIARSSTPGEVEAALREAHRQLAFSIEETKNAPAQATTGPLRSGVQSIPF